MYCIDPHADVPIMLINKHIGFDSEEGQGIDGSSFQNELMLLDGMGKTRIEVYINSPGGSVLDGWNIFSAIAHSKTPVDTYNVGMCASIAGIIYMAGRKRYAADYSLFMMHNPFIPGDDSGDNEGMQKIKQSLVKQITANSGLDEAQVSALMDKTTWLDAAECIEMGIATDIVSTPDANKKYLPKTADSKALWKQFVGVENSILNKTTGMKLVANFLKINENSNEEAVLGAIKETVNALTAEAEAANKSKAEIKEQMDKLKEQYDALKAEYDKMKDAADKAENDAKEAKKAQALVEAKAFVQAHVGKRITNDAKAIEAWVNKAVEDFDGTKALIESIPLNAKASALHEVGATDVQGGYTAGYVNAMNEAKKKAGN